MGLGDVAQGAAGRNVAHRGALLVLKHIVGNGHQGIFLAKRLAVLANQRQTVHIGVYADAKVGIVGHNCLAQAHQIGRQRLGIVGKMARRLTVYGDALHAQLLQKARHNHAAHRIHRVQHHFEVRRLYGRQVHQRIGLHGVDVDLGIIFIGDGAKLQHLLEIKILFGCGCQNLLALCVGEKLAVAAQKLEGIPLGGIVAGGDYNAAVRLFAGDRKFCGGGGGHTYIDNLYTAGNQRVTHNAVYHRAGDAGVAAHNNPLAAACKSGGKLHDVYGGQSVAHCAAYGAPDSGY